jgi:hypothetical protein
VLPSTVDRYELSLAAPGGSFASICDSVPPDGVRGIDEGERKIQINAEQRKNVHANPCYLPLVENFRVRYYHCCHETKNISLSSFYINRRKKKHSKI